MAGSTRPFCTGFVGDGGFASHWSCCEMSVSNSLFVEISRFFCAAIAPEAD
jgi:hypothetical protein